MAKSDFFIDNPIQIQNPILTLDCQSQSNTPNWIATRIEQFSNPIQQYPGVVTICDNLIVTLYLHVFWQVVTSDMSWRDDSVTR